MRARVHGDLSDLAADLKMLATRTKPELSTVVRDAARTGNRHAKAFASEEHTMFSDVDIDYAPSFTVERKGALTYEYGPDANVGDGSKASGYEFGSVNQASPHQNLDRSLDIMRVEFPMDVSDKMRELFHRAGFL